MLPPGYHASSPIDLILEEFDGLEASRIDWTAHPQRWANERLGVHLWSKQVEIMESVRDHRRTVVHSCHSSGKSYTASAVASWWIDSHPLGEAFVLTSAPTAPQVKALLWKEIRRRHEEGKLPGYVNLTEWYIEHNGQYELVAFGRKPSEHSEAAFQGFHAKYVLIIFDEAAGIPKSLWDAAESVASNRNSRILAIGNPDSVTGEFADACADESPYNVIHIGYHHTPNFTSEPVPDELRDYLISPEWVEDRRENWGEDTALFQAKVLGQFPSGDVDPWKVIPLEMATACRYLEFDQNPADPLIRVGGIDVGGGGDRTVIVERVGADVGRIRSFASKNPEDTTAELVNLIVDWGLQRVHVDVIGIGWGVLGSLRKELAELMPATTVVGVNAANASAKPARFANVRADLWWNGRELSRTRAWGLANLDDDAIYELTAPRYELRNGKILIEPKDEIRKRLKRSPDIADAVLLAFYPTGQSAAPPGNPAETFKRSTPPTQRRRPLSPFGQPRTNLGRDGSMPMPNLLGRRIGQS